MSSTEIYGFNKDGNAYFAGETENSWRSAPAIWSYLEEKYLPPFIPDSIKDTNWYYEGIPYYEIVSRMHYTPTRCSSLSPKSMQEVWDLCEREDIPIEERIVLATTFDKYLVKKEDIPDVVNAFLQFGAENSSLKEQADILNKLYNSDDCIAIGWNQTNVIANNWSNYNTIDDECAPYNCLKQSDHYWLFEDII